MRCRLALILTALAALGRADQIDDLAKAHMAADHVPGMALGVCKDGTLIEERYYGVSNLETQTPVGEKTVFRIASMSKQFTASSILLLQQEGKLDLDKGVRTYLPDAPKEWEPTTIRQLLFHASGIPELAHFDYAREYSDNEFFALFEGKPLTEAPGSTYRYNNYGYATLGLVVKALSGKRLREFVAERFFVPSGMSDSRYYTMSEIVPNRALGYRWTKEGGYANQLILRPQVFDGSGGVMTTLRDLAKWDATLHTDSPLTAAMKKQLWTPNLTTGGKDTKYGFGWHIETGAHGLEVSHNGTSFGFTARWRRFVDKKLTVIILRNGGSSDGAIKTFEESISALVVAK